MKKLQGDCVSWLVLLVEAAQLLLVCGEGMLTYDVCRQYSLLDSIHNPLPVVCPSLPALNNGIVSYSDSKLDLGTVATYTCDTGYTLNGGTNRTCESGGVWSGSDLVCQREWNRCFVCVLTPI